MRRQSTGAEERRDYCRNPRPKPGICLCTTLIAGFPGETEEDVEDVKDFLQQQRFDRVGIFT